MTSRVRRLAREQVMMLQGMARLVVDTLELRYCDEVTGMSNRQVFLHHLQLGLEQATLPHVVVGFINLAGFRRINDVFGRLQGDHVLREVGSGWPAGPGRKTGRPPRRRPFRLCPVRRARRACGAAGAAQGVLDAPLVLGRGGSHVLHARVGIEHHDTPYRGSAVLLDAADTASSSIVGHLPRTTVQEYGAELLTRSHMVFELQGALDGDVRYGMLVAHYQPQVDYTCGALIGLEALVRWQHPLRGTVFPGQLHPAGGKHRQDLPARHAGAGASVPRHARLA
jgi:predicted signal transduction protein with EAL and GGDEF domain